MENKSESVKQEKNSAIPTGKGETHSQVSAAQRSRRVAAQKRTTKWLTAEVQRLQGASNDYSRGKLAGLASALRMLEVN